MTAPKLSADDLKNLTAALAVIVSVTSLVVSVLVSRRSSVTGRRPVLVFDYDGNTGWRVRNVGSGPALNVIIAQKQVGGGWFNPVRIPPLAKDGEFSLSWCLHVNDTGLGAVYADVEGLLYSSRCGNDLTTVQRRSIFPKWEERQIGRHWNHPNYVPGKVA